MMCVLDANGSMNRENTARNVVIITMIILRKRRRKMIILEINNPKDTGKLLKDIRLSHGLTQADAARSMDMLPETLSRIERGIKAVTIEYLDRIVSFYGIEEVRITTNTVDWRRCT